MAEDLAYNQKTGDLIWTDTGPVMISGLEEIRQALTSIILTPIGLFVDETVGMDYDWVLGGYDEKMAINEITEALKQDERVIEVDSVTASHDPETRSVTFLIKVATTLGILNFEQEVSFDAVNE
jgi:phage baseplate assembly protein W